jgi:hypothetical protein
MYQEPSTTSSATAHDTETHPRLGWRDLVDSLLDALAQHWKEIVGVAYQNYGLASPVERVYPGNIVWKTLGSLSSQQDRPLDDIEVNERFRPPKFRQLHQSLHPLPASSLESTLPIRQQ